MTERPNENPMNIAIELWDKTDPMVTANMSKASYLIGVCEGVKYLRNRQPHTPEPGKVVQYHQNELWEEIKEDINSADKSYVPLRLFVKWKKEYFLIKR